MKTPDLISLTTFSGPRRYDALTDTYKTRDEETIQVPCFVSRVSKRQVFEMYGSREDNVISVRFMQPVKPFEKAVFRGKTYKPIETIDGPIKEAIRLKEVQYGP